VLHHFLSEHKGIADALTYLCAGVAVVSLTQAALLVTITAGLISIILGGIRLHDRLKYGPGGKE
jgi:hypothetical protein